MIVLIVVNLSVYLVLNDLVLMWFEYLVCDGFFILVKKLERRWNGARASSEVCTIRTLTRRPLHFLVLIHGVR